MSRANGPAGKSVFRPSYKAPTFREVSQCLTVNGEPRHKLPIYPMRLLGSVFKVDVAAQGAPPLALRDGASRAPSCVSGLERCTTSPSGHCLLGIAFGDTRDQPTSAE